MLENGSMLTTSSGRVKGGILQSRLEFVRQQKGEESVQGVLDRLSDADRKVIGHVLSSMWYPFEVNARLDEAIAAELGTQNAFLVMGEQSAQHNLAASHRIFITDRDPHGLLKRAAQIYQMYYDTGHRTYEHSGDKKAVLRTHESTTFSVNDCQTVVGWHRKAIEMCGGASARVTETKCRAKGADVCEYVCEWS